MWFWKHNKSTKPVIISTDNLKKLPKKAQAHFSPAALSLHGGCVTHEVIHHDDSGENFGLSVLAGMATDDVALGYLAGGSLSGAIIGEMLAESSHSETTFDGGSGGGSGATASYDSGPSYDTSSSSDYSSSSDSSSYDSGSSYDSSSSCDSSF